MKNIAVIGTGYWGKNIVRNFHALGALHTVCNVDPETVRTFEQYSGVNGGDRDVPDYALVVRQTGTTNRLDE